MLFNTEAQELEIQTTHLKFSAKVWHPEIVDENLTIIAIHGWLDNAESFSLLAPLLEGYRIIAVDLCGHGKSDHRPAGVPYHFVDYVADIFYIANALGIHRFHLLGHSLGGNIASIMAATYPEKVLSLMLIEGFGPVTRKIEETALNLRESTEKFIAHDSKKRRYAEFSSLVKARLQGRWPLTEEAAELLCKRGSVEKDGKFSWSSDAAINYTSPLRMSEQQAAFMRSQIVCATLLIIGEQGIAPQLNDNRAPLNEFKNRQVHRMQGHHHLHMERAQLPELSERLLNFLQVHSDALIAY